MVLCQGYYNNDSFMVISIEHPPLHANKQLRFKLTDQDYFGAYNVVRDKSVFEKP